ncbi:glycosyltransferase family 2 protein [Vibrio mexicanus]|uniref:glycosyltransferase family 2 protein n=1 Tax=Vibrio mexicanus TaxID=1004326 RepID=UPI00063C029D|nr:glycosyltransferase family 2 protein [Vibrio mexicanus]
MKEHEPSVDLYAVVVWFNPNSKTIEFWNQLAMLLPLVVVDNTPSVNKIYSSRQIANARLYIDNGDNLGIAKALNQGLEFGLKGKSDQELKRTWCIQFDQDSRIEHSVLMKMKEAAEAASEKTAAIAPSYYETNVGRVAPAIRVKPFHIVKITPIGERPILASYVISSGCVINLYAANVIGLHDESLFIDFVDIEWGLRASSLGFKIWLLPTVKMTHCLGDNPVKLGNVKLPNHSPIRHYYYFRNVLLMVRKPFVPISWKVVELAKLPVRFIIYALFTKCKTQQIKSMFNGFIDGVKGKSGKFISTN